MCCENQSTGILSALQAFAFAAWGDMSAAKVDPLKVVAARKLGIDYAEKKPVWKNGPLACEKKRMEEYRAPLDRHQQRGR